MEPHAQSGDFVNNFYLENENASFFAASTLFLNLVCTIFHPIIYLSTTTHTEHRAVGVLPRCLLYPSDAAAE